MNGQLVDTENFKCFIMESMLLLLLLSEHPQVVSVFVSQARRLHTTRSWGFLGLEEAAGES